jgi:hypothetical protein
MYERDSNNSYITKPARGARIGHVIVKFLASKEPGSARLYAELD